MKSKILIIENELKDFKKIKESIGINDYNLIPKDDEEFNEILQHMNNNTLETHINNIIANNYSTLRLIICDLALSGDLHGEDLIESIRNNILPGAYLFPRLIPIIVYTNHADEYISKQALENGATHIIQKGQEHQFPHIVKSMINYFNIAYINRDITYVQDELKDITMYLKNQNQLITSSLGDLQILIKGNQEETLNKFDFIFKVIFESINQDKKNRIYHKFRNEIETILDQDEINKINENTWKQIKNAIVDVNKGGGFKEFVNSSYDIFEKAGFLESARSKIIGSAIKGIFAILSTS